VLLLNVELKLRLQKRGRVVEGSPSIRIE